MTPVNFFNRSLIRDAICKRQSRACGMRRFRWRFGMEIFSDASERQKANSVPVIIEQTAAAQTSIEAKVLRLNKPD